MTAHSGGGIDDLLAHSFWIGSSDNTLEGIHFPGLPAVLLDAAKKKLAAFLAWRSL